MCWKFVSSYQKYSLVVIFKAFILQSYLRRQVEAEKALQSQPLSVSPVLNDPPLVRFKYHLCHKPLLTASLSQHGLSIEIDSLDSDSLGCSTDAIDNRDRSQNGSATSN